MLISTTTNTPDLQVQLTGYHLRMTVEFKFYRFGPITELPEDVQQAVLNAIASALSVMDPVHGGDPGAAIE